MKILVTLAALLISAVAMCADEDGKAVEGRELKSTILGRNVRYSVYLPRGYEFDSTRRYPVVYLLQGDPSQSASSESDWIQRGSADRLTGSAIGEGRFPPVILIMPEPTATGYTNGADARSRCEDMFVQEFIPYIDRTFRTRPQPLFRGVVGFSMGGRDALLLALRHPELFSTAAALSPAIRTEDEMVSASDAEYSRFWAALSGPNLQGEARLNASWRATSPLYLAKTLPVDQLRRTRIWIDTGDDDPFSTGSAALHTVLRQRDIPHEYRVRDGSHEWTYWRAGLVDALEFVARAYW